MSYARSFKVTVVVSANTGTGAFVFPTISGIRIRTISIDAPNSATYDWTLKDADSYAITGSLAATDDETYSGDFPISSSGTIVFVNASNGTYNIKIWAEYN